jgi:hypothetical protein
LSGNVTWPDELSVPEPGPNGPVKVYDVFGTPPEITTFVAVLAEILVGDAVSLAPTVTVNVLVLPDPEKLKL